MSESSIKPVGAVRLGEASKPSRDLFIDHTEASTSLKPTTADIEELTKRIKKESGGSMSNISIHFRLDDKSNELTVFVVDRKTKRVLRSIPASELHKLQAGELLKLTA